VEIFDEGLGRLRCAIGGNVVERSRLCGLEGGCAGGGLMRVGWGVSGGRRVENGACWRGRGEGGGLACAEGHCRKGKRGAGVNTRLAGACFDGYAHAGITYETKVALSMVH